MKSLIYEYLERNKKKLCIILTLFILGITIGILFVNNVNQEQMKEIEEYVNKVVDNMKQSDSINKVDLLLQSIKQNSAFVLFVWLLRMHNNR